MEVGQTKSTLTSNLAWWSLPDPRRLVVPLTTGQGGAAGTPEELDKWAGNTGSNILSLSDSIHQDGWGGAGQEGGGLRYHPAIPGEAKHTQHTCSHTQHTTMYNHTCTTSHTHINTHTGVYLCLTRGNQTYLDTAHNHTLPQGTQPLQCNVKKDHVHAHINTTTPAGHITFHIFSL